MTQAEKLEALVAHAFERGYVEWWVHHVANPDLTGWIEDDIYFWTYNKGEFAGQPIEDDVPVYSVIFNKDFARALFGEHDIAVESGENIPLNGKRLSLLQKVPACDYHRQQAVISDNPIDYYYRKVFGDNN
jgi:hypothetical protein